MKNDGLTTLTNRVKKKKEKRKMGNGKWKMEIRSLFTYTLVTNYRLPNTDYR
jgi:hypothetical protein